MKTVYALVEKQEDGEFDIICIYEKHEEARQMQLVNEKDNPNHDYSIFHTLMAEPGEVKL